MINPFSNMSLDEQAAAIRDADERMHPFVGMGITFLPPKFRPVATATDKWLYDLVQTPGVLEQVLQIFPAGAPAPVPTRHGPLRDDDPNP